MPKKKSGDKRRPKGHHIHNRMVVVKKWENGVLMAHTVHIYCEPPCFTSATQEQLPW